MIFYLVDANTGATLNQVAAQVLLQPASGYLLAAQNPIQNPAGQLGSATLNWSSSTATMIEVHVGSPSGPLFTRGANQGSATASGWVTDGTTFYLQDVSNGQPLTSQFTIATQTISFTPSQPGASFQASPNPILVAPGTQFGSTTLYWSAPSSVLTVEIHVGSPTGPLFAQGPASGNASVSGWVTDGLVFYLQDVTQAKPLTSANTLATVTAHLVPTQ